MLQKLNLLYALLPPCIFVFHQVWCAQQSVDGSHADGVHRSDPGQ